MKKQILAALFLVLVSLASVGTEITGVNNHIQFPHYSLVLPTPDWHLRSLDEKNEVAVVALQTKPPNSAIFQMAFLRQTFRDESTKSWTARQIADDYRNQEKRTMIELGVNTGQYQLHGKFVLRLKIKQIEDALN